MTTHVFNSARFEPAHREAASIAEGKRILASKLSPAAFLHTFGHPAPRTMAHAAKAAAATPARVKAYAKETGPFEPRKLHCFVNRAWLA